MLNTELLDHSIVRVYVFCCRFDNNLNAICKMYSFYTGFVPVKPLKIIFIKNVISQKIFPWCVLISTKLTGYKF